MTDIRFLKSEEKAMYALRALYRKYGYLPYKMNKFEEYELYVRNKDFLVSDRIITFNDTDGSLMALKPDVTLSIIKNGDFEQGKQKVCYNENVYRVSDSTGRFRELMQSGLECIGEIDEYDIFEVIYLAAQSLSLVSDSYLLEVSHLGIISAMLEEACGETKFTDDAIRFIAEKNRHDLKKLCEAYGVDAQKTDEIVSLVTIYGNRSRVLTELAPICRGKARKMLDKLAAVSELLDTSEVADRVIFDFSVVNNINYYNGVVFRGFIDGISNGVLSGGQYDALMHRLGKSDGAVGFAFYLDMLERLQDCDRQNDVDVLVLYDEKTDKTELARQVRQLAAYGVAVRAQKAVPTKLSYERIIDMRGGSSC